jgi:hypothetical protein
MALGLCQEDGDRSKSLACSEQMELGQTDMIHSQGAELHFLRSFVA